MKMDAKTREKLTRALCARYQKGDRTAGSGLIQLHLGLVAHFARKKCSRRGKWGRRKEFYSDFCQEGAIGLLSAADSYDPSKQPKTATFSHWAARYIRSAIQSYQDGFARDIVATPKMLVQAKRLGRERRTTNPTSCLVADLHLTHTYSIDHPLNPEIFGRSTVKELFRDDSPNVEEKLDSYLVTKLSKRVVSHLLSCLNPRQQRVIQDRFFQGLSLQEIGTHFDVSRERIRQIESEALGLMRVKLDSLGWEDPISVGLDHVVRNLRMEVHFSDAASVVEA